MKKSNFITHLILVVLILSIMSSCSIINKNTKTYNKLESLYLSTNYDDVYNEYNAFFNTDDYMSIIQKEQPTNYNDIIDAYKSKYLLSVLYANDDEYVNQFNALTKNISKSDLSILLINMYQILMIDTKNNDELYSKIINALNKNKINSDNASYNELYMSFMYFCQIADENNNDMANSTINQLKDELKDSFNEFWNIEISKYCEALLLNRLYIIFNDTFINACTIEDVLPTVSISYLINVKEFDKEQLSAISNTLCNLSNIVKDDNWKKALNSFAEMATQEQLENGS